ncbi:MAG TPA: methyltransferase domain-containing protein [Pyrinomonadaceae bacterium]|nr:methyltransferase domain-containing protein [Pyrinomonadaceae bacterium]
MKPSYQLESAVDQLYRHRFPASTLAERAAVWQVICRTWFARYVPQDARVLDLAAGYCEFINHIEAAERVAVDLNPETAEHAAPGVAVHHVAAEDVHTRVPANYFDVVFVSNFLEHCRTRDQVLDVLGSTRTILKPGGRVLILGPNFRYCYKEYFDYFDHYLPLTEKAIVEALELSGFEVEEVEPRTLPFTFRSRLPSWPWLVRLYLKMPFVWRVFGAQFFVVGRKAS